MMSSTGGANLNAGDFVGGDGDNDDDVSYEDKLLLNKNLATVISLTQNRRLRTSFSAQQIELLESIFMQTHYPDAGLREEISHSTGLNDSKIQVRLSKY